MILAIVGILFIGWLLSLYYESGAARDFVAELRRVWKSMGVQGRIVLGSLVVFCTLTGGAKGPGPVTELFRVLFWPNGGDWALMAAQDDNIAAQAALVAATNATTEATNMAAQVEAYVESNEVVTISFDWHSPNRLPYHDRQNVLGRTVWVQPTNILGTLYEDHYVAFNESATTNPAVILIEYARKRDNGTIERYSAQTITNSYPDMVAVNLQSGSHTCYWFRCAVPVAFTNCCVRDWNGEALFGSPEDSGKGFDLLGTLVIDDGDNIWQGATTNMVFGGITNAVQNGIVLEP